MNSIQTTNLGMVYRSGLIPRKKVALRNLSLEVGRNEIFGYLGANGAGKTTTLKILVHLMRPTSGSAQILGEDISSVAVRRKIGYQPENPYFYEYLTTEETLRFYAKLFGIPRAERQRRIGRMIDLMNIPGVRRMRVREFSRGMRQRLGLAQALINEPELVFLDEPMSGLDPLGRIQVRDIILRLKQEGKTVFFSSHILSDVEVICDRVGLLVNGELVSVGRVNDLVASQVKTIEIRVENLPPAALDQVRPLATGLVAQGAMTHLTVADEKAGQEAVRIIAASGAVLKEYAPHKESLEEYFLRHAGGVGTNEKPG